MYRFVVIDDESLSRRGIMKKLENLADLVECCGEAENGQEGIERIRETNPDFVILDMQMPVMDGMKLLPYLAQHFPQLPLIVISGYTNFEYMKQAISSKVINYILKPFSRDELQDTVRSVISALEKKESLQRELSFAYEEQQMAWLQLDLRMIENLIWGHSPDSLIIRSRALDFLSDCRRYVLLLLYFQDQPDGQFRESIVESDPAMGPWVYFPSSSRSKFGFVLWLPRESIEADRAMTALFARRFISSEDPAQPRFTLAASEVHRDLPELHEALREARSAMDGLRTDNPLPAEPLFRENFQPSLIHWEKETEFLFRVESGDEARALELLGGLFELYGAKPGCTLADVKHHCEALCTQFRRQLRTSSTAGSEELPLPSTHTMLTTLFSFEDIRQGYSQFFSDACRSMAHADINKKSALIDRVEAYIQWHYDCPLTQELIASLYFVNRSYLSKLFKEQTGKKFADYLNDLRIDRAKELLLNTDKQVFKIARMVGYDNDKYFFKLFKARTGMSPEDFRAAGKKQ